MRDRAMFPLCVNSHHCLGKAAVNEKPRVGRQKFCGSGFPQLKAVFISVLLAGAVLQACKQNRKKAILSCLIFRHRTSIAQLFG